MHKHLVAEHVEQVNGHLVPGLEAYLGWHYNHGCVMVGININATGEELPKRLHDSVFGEEAVAAYREFLAGEPLQEKAVVADDPQARPRAKIERLHAGIRHWREEGKDLSAVGKMTERIHSLVVAGKFGEAEKLIDQTLESLGETIKAPDVYGQE